MTICREWVLVKHLPEEKHAKLLVCRSWSCEYCQPMRRTRLMAQAASGEPTRFLTLTVNPQIGDSPEHRLHMLANAWKITVKRLRRRYAPKPIEYLAVVEETKNGEPHLHILLRSPYISQRFISDCMGELIDSPIVDIRRIHTLKEVVRYVAKYITKAPAQFGKAKRYWCSQGYEVDKPDDKAPDRPKEPAWVLVREHISLVLTQWIQDGYVPRLEGPEQWLGVRTNYEFFGRKL